MSVCPCHSGKPYSDCCEPYHKGAAAPNAELLMRSRYAAYAKGLADYIVRTTDERGPLYQNDLAAWHRDILQFSRSSEFTSLRIEKSWEKGKEAMVQFRAGLKQNGADASFTERSRFRKEQGRWYYSSAESR